MLTRKQYELLRFIAERLGEDGVSPSFDEMKDALGLKSKSGIHRLIGALEERGFLRRLPHRARALEILRMPEAHERKASAANAIKKAPIPMRAAPANDVVSVPLFGRIAAGTPIEALRDPGSFVEAPAAMLGSGEHYALSISGDSMVGAGILDGDTVLIRRSETANDGDIVVALVDDAEATLKTLRRIGGKVALEAANPAFETRLLPPGRVKVQGRLVGLLRKY